MSPQPLGVVPTTKGHQVSVYAPDASALRLVAYDPDATKPFAELAFAPDARDDEGVWSIEVSHLPTTFEYGFRVAGGPLLLDPYARALTGGEEWGRSDDAIAPGVGRRYRSFHRDWAFDWQGVERPKIDPERRLIYEAHVRGFTRHPSSGVTRPGTYLGLLEKIPYFRSLGVTTLELMPVFEFDETENPRRNPTNGERLLNFWGYSPVSFFAPKAAYASDPGRGAAVDEFRVMVRELHRAGIEVVLDVVYNHTAEGGGGRTDPLHSWRALAPEVYYIVDRATRAPIDVTGCGNTVNANHPVVRRLILDSLRYWASEMRVDGFRFDLASALYRGERGEILAQPPILDEIARESALADVLLIAEPWDITGYSPPGGFPAPWREWNGVFRDDLRRFVRGDSVPPETMARRMAGSPDRFAPPRTPKDSIDYVACHDGLTLADLVAYERKHNAENGEKERDGASESLSSSYGVEGPSADPAIVELRARQVRNFLALLLATRGTPMLLAGDERGRTQRGNNNAWCQDNEIGWLDWGVDSPQLVEFARGAGALRGEWAAWSGKAEATPLSPLASASEGGAFALLRRTGEPPVRAAIVAANASGADVRFALPPPPQDLAWRLVIDTRGFGGSFLFAGASRPAIAAGAAELVVPARSVRILVAGDG